MECLFSPACSFLFVCSCWSLNQVYRRQQGPIRAHSTMIIRLQTWLKLLGLINQLNIHSREEKEVLQADIWTKNYNPSIQSIYALHPAAPLTSPCSPSNLRLFLPRYSITWCAVLAICSLLQLLDPKGFGLYYPYLIAVFRLCGAILLKRCRHIEPCYGKRCNHTKKAQSYMSAPLHYDCTYPHRNSYPFYTKNEDCTFFKDCTFRCIL